MSEKTTNTIYIYIYIRNWLFTSNRAMYAKRAAATVSRTRDQGNQNPRVPKLNLEDTKKRKNNSFVEMNSSNVDLRRKTEI